jgi:DNA polymerase-3 subunit epsilon
MNHDQALVDATTLLESNPDFKVIKRITPRSAFAENDGKALLRGVVVDTETTGVNADQDAIIELGMVFFEYDPETGNAYQVTDVFDELEDPGMPIPPESTDVHGITDEMVAGKKINDAAVEALLEGVSIVIAHNSKFDRVFLEKRLPIFETLPWACTFAQIDWHGEGVGSAKLDYIAYTYGFFYDAHRAEVDCFALLEILQQKLPQSNQLVLKALLDALPEKSFTIYALKSAFETKDILKGRGYRWNGEKKSWHTTVSGNDAILEEVAWLKAEVYNGRSAQVEVEVFNCLTRFSNRAGNRAIKEI